MQGILLYDEEHYKINYIYANWLISYGKEIGLDIHLIFTKDIYKTNYTNLKFVINRTRNYNYTLLFELNSIPVFNNSKINLLGNNKLFAYKYAMDKNIPFLPIEIDGNTQSVEKTVDGFGGKDIYLKKIKDCSEKIYQKFHEHVIGDVRFYIVNNKIAHCVIRENNNSFIKNFSKGGTASIYNYSKIEENILKQLIENLNIDYCGVDFLLTKNNFYFNEIEDVVGSRMLSALGINNTHALFLEHIKNTLEAKTHE